MTNRLKELKENLPKSKEAIDNLINTIASWSNGFIDDDIMSRTINKLSKDIDNECMD